MGWLGVRRGNGKRGVSKNDMNERKQKWGTLAEKKVSSFGSKRTKKENLITFLYVIKNKNPWQQKKIREIVYEGINIEVGIRITADRSASILQ